MKAIQKVVSSEYLERMCRDHYIHSALLDLLPSKIRKDIEPLRGIPNDKLAEIVIAFAKNTIAIDGDGMDFLDKSEGKFANICVHDDPKDGKVYQKTSAKISNLKSKTGDLHVIVSDTISEFGKVHFKFFSFPYKVWKDKIPGDCFNLHFGSSRWKWYSDYEYSWEEFLSGKRGLEKFV